MVNTSKCSQCMAARTKFMIAKLDAWGFPATIVCKYKEGGWVLSMSSAEPPDEHVTKIVEESQYVVCTMCE